MSDPRYWVFASNGSVNSHKFALFCHFSSNLGLFDQNTVFYNLNEEVRNSDAGVKNLDTEVWNPGDGI